MSFPKRTKLAVSLYIGKSKVRKCFIFIYLAITKYKTINVEGEDAKHLFLISYERTVRNDHLEIFQSVFDKTASVSNDSCMKIEYLRVLNLSLISILLTIKKSKFNIFVLLKLQMDEVVENISFRNVRNVIVFCDTMPLTNYIVEYCHIKGIETFGMQHGFYPLPVNDYWRRIYWASNAEKMFAWDHQTIELMNKYSGNRNREFVKAGPISSVNVNVDKVKIDEDGDKAITIQKIAIYSAGIDQCEINHFIIKLIKYIKTNTELEVVYICHPYFKLFDRLKHSLRTGVKHSSNIRKNDNYDLHVVLNSSVWLELEIKKVSYIRLDDLYQNKKGLEFIIKEISNFDSKGVSERAGLRAPFYNSDESLRVISRFISRAG